MLAARVGNLLPNRHRQTQPTDAARARYQLAGLVAALLGLGFATLLSLRFGSLSIGNRDAWHAVFDYDPDNYHEYIVRTLRLPRTIIAAGVGAGLAAAGATIQAVTRNPLADPSILGISNGASLGVVIAIYAFGLTAASQFLWFSFGGALLAAVVVTGIAASGRGGASPIKLALSGVVIAWALSAWTSALILLDEETMDTARFWLAGSVAGRDLGSFWTVAPFLIGGTLVCAFLGHQLNVISLGDDMARSLGMNTTRLRLICIGLTVIVAGAAVAVAGPIAFVGLATPHIVRAVVGPDYRWVLPYSIVLGATLLVAADVVGRLIVWPSELQVGIVTAILGAPFLIVLARRQRLAD